MDFLNNILIFDIVDIVRNYNMPSIEEVKRKDDKNFYALKYEYIECEKKFIINGDNIEHLNRRIFKKIKDQKQKKRLKKYIKLSFNLDNVDEITEYMRILNLGIRRETGEGQRLYRRMNHL